MHHGDKATGMRRQWIVLLVLLVALLVLSAGPGYAQRGGHGGGHGGHSGHGGHGRHHFGHGGHGFIGVSVWPYWDPYWPYWGSYWGSYWGPYGVPQVVAPSPQIYVQPAPTTWYYCDDPQGYYPYVQQCPGGWRPVTPTPP